MLHLAELSRSEQHRAGLTFDKHLLQPVLLNALLQQSDLRIQELLVNLDDTCTWL